MKVRVEAWHLPPRLLTGMYFLNSGLSKAGADEATAAQLHGFASGTYPFLRKLDARQFTRLLSAAETAIGVALVLPVVPAGLAGAALTAFAVGTLGLYLRTPGLRREGSLPGRRPALVPEGCRCRRDVGHVQPGQPPRRG
jgi:hypothetical protein